VEARLAEEATHPLGFRKTYGELLEVQAHRLKKAILDKEACTPQYLRIH
jgi:CRISPR-associated protein Cas1